MNSMANHESKLASRVLLREQYIILESKSHIKDKSYKAGKRNGRIRDMWDGINKRCRESFWLKRETYTGTINEFKNYKEFVLTISDLMCKADLISLDGLELDKDLLSTDKKVYSPNTVILLPSEINFALAKLIPSVKNKTGYAGISSRYNKASTSYVVKDLNLNGKQVNKSFSTIEQAKDFYFKITSLRWAKYMSSHNILVASQSYNAYLKLMMTTTVEGLKRLVSNLVVNKVMDKSCYTAH